MQQRRPLQLRSVLNASSPSVTRLIDWQARSQKDAHRAAAARSESGAADAVAPTDLRLCVAARPLAAARAGDRERVGRWGASSSSLSAAWPHAPPLPVSPLSAVSCHKAALERSESDLRCLHAQLTAKDGQSQSAAASASCALSPLSQPPVCSYRSSSGLAAAGDGGGSGAMSAEQQS
jgi:hypothetical protein